MSDELGFTYEKHNNEFRIYRHGKSICVLRGAKASKFDDAISSNDESGLQKVMAKLTGNYKRGNERSSKQHNRNS